MMVASSLTEIDRGAEVLCNMSFQLPEKKELLLFTLYFIVLIVIWMYVQPFMYFVCAYLCKRGINHADKLLL